jgi:hypothetical protein
MRAAFSFARFSNAQTNSRIFIQSPLLSFSLFDGPKKEADGIIGGFRAERRPGHVWLGSSASRRQREK